MNERRIKSVLEKALSGGRNSKVLRFLLGCLGGTPVVGGAFGATAAAWSESEQTKVNALLHEALQIQDEMIREVKNNLLVERESMRWVAAYVKFNPNKAEFLDASNISSLGYNGNLDFSISFASPLEDSFTLQYFGSGEVRLKGIIESKYVVRVRFLDPCPDMVTFVFFNLGLVPTSQQVLPVELP